MNTPSPEPFLYHSSSSSSGEVAASAAVEMVAAATPTSGRVAAAAALVATAGAALVLAAAAGSSRSSPGSSNVNGLAAAIYMAAAPAPVGLALVAADLQLEMGRRSSSSNMQPAEQYVSPHDMVTLAMSSSLLAHPQLGPSLRNKIRELRGVALGHPKGAMYEEEDVSELQGVVSAACPHLTDACATGLALVLLALCVQGLLRVKCDLKFVGEEAVAAFYAALEQPTCVVEELTICGDAFGTRTAAAHLASCLNRNSTIRKLTIHYVPGFSDEAVWVAFSHALTSNNTLHELWLTGSSHGPGNTAHVCATLADSHKLSALREMTVTGWGTPATMEDMERWGAFLKHNSTIAKLKLGGFVLPQGGGLLVPIARALLTNTTLRISFALITAWV